MAIPNEHEPLKAVLAGAAAGLAIGFVALFIGEPSVHTLPHQLRVFDNVIPFIAVGAFINLCIAQLRNRF